MTERAGAVATLAIAAAGLGCASCAAGPPGVAGGGDVPGDPVRVEARAIDVAALDPPGPGLRWSAALALRAPDAPEFGGFSGLRVDATGRLTAVTDRGRWWTAALRRDGAGILVGVGEGRMGRLEDARGLPLADKSVADAEALARLPDGRFAVAFERTHRLAAYAVTACAPTGPATPIPPPDLSDLASNSGLEALAALPDGRLVALVEEAPREGLVRGWIQRGADREGTGWEPIRVRVDIPLLRPTDLAPWPGGGLLLLERMAVPPVGVSARLSLVDPRRTGPDGAWRPETLGWIAPPHPVDNFEAASAATGPDGSVRVYLLSDDNFRDLQRTLLLELEWTGEAGRLGGIAPPPPAGAGDAR